MYLDASAIVAILNDEPEAERLKAQIMSSVTPLHCSALTVFEAVVSLARTKTPKEQPVQPAMLAKIRKIIAVFLSELGVKDVLISQSIGLDALDAASIYGKMVAHPAQLNFGDCFAYACAKAYRLPLLYIGNDFSKTDLGSQDSITKG